MDVEPGFSEVNENEPSENFYCTVSGSTPFGEQSKTHGRRAPGKLLLAHTQAMSPRNSMLLLVALLGAAMSSAMQTRSAFTTRRVAKTSCGAIVCRLGDLAGEPSRRVDFVAKSICENGPGGREVCRKVHALGAHDDLDADLSETADLPSWWILRAEEDFRSSMQSNRNEQLE
mmetsp:Transcript_27028/g.72860  ORF Transcript_27028/g.72860 Transcript_27028/m.72860 type:complete len:173 (+) Transcript_27028:96-614(+)